MRGKSSKSFAGIPIAFAVAWCLLACGGVIAATDPHAQVCRLFKRGTTMRKPGTCDQYIVCDGDIGTVHTCPSPQQYSVDKQKCETPSSPSTGNCDTLCGDSKLDGTWLADPSSCNGYYYCSNGRSLFGACPKGMHFDGSSMMCVYEKSSTCVDFNGLCAMVKEKTTFRDEKDCSFYYECVKGAQKRNTCTASKVVRYFDVDNGCMDRTKVQCKAHPNPGCGTDSKPVKGRISDDATCRGYFVCKDLGIVADLEPQWYQCPVGTFFDSVTKTCTEPIDAVCQHNRCEDRPDMLVATSSGGCHNYIQCENGQEVAGPITCQKHMYFHEPLQVCVQNLIEYKCCDGR